MSSIGNLPGIRYFREAREELRKVSWPNQRDTFIYSAFVIGLSVTMAVYFGLLDWLLTQGLEALITYGRV